MPATLTEAFQAPKFDSSAYTRSSVDIRNPNYASGQTSYNSHIQHTGVSGHPVNYGNQAGAGQTPYAAAAQVSSNSSDIVNTAYQLGGGQSNDTISLLSSISSSSFSNEAESIKRKYQQLENFDDGIGGDEDSGKNCDAHIYHILSCSNCRRKLRKLLSDDDKEEFQGGTNNNGNNVNNGNNNNGNNSNINFSLQDLKDLLIGTKNQNNQQSNGNLLDFSFLNQNDNMQSILTFVLSGIFLIFLLDFFRRFGR